jgi:hypothetical protein
MIVEGSDELQAQLEALETRIVRQATKSGTVQGLTIIKRAIVQRTPRGKTQQLVRSIGKRLIKTKSGTIEGKAGINVGKRTGRGLNGGKSSGAAPHGHLVTLGTADRYTQRGAYRGRVRPNDFVNQGFNASQGQAASTLIGSIKAALENT